MEKETKQFEDSLEDWTPEEKVMIEQMRSAYRNEMSDSGFVDFKRNFWDLYHENAAELQHRILSSTGMNRENNEKILFDFYFHTAQLLAEGGFIADSIEFLTRRRDELRDYINTKKMVLVSQPELVFRRFTNALDAYREKLVPQYIRDIDAEKPLISEVHVPHGVRSMMLAPGES